MTSAPYRRRLDERVRVTLPARPVTCTVTPRQVETYLRQTGWTPLEEARGHVTKRVPDARDRSTPLADVIEKIAQHEKRYPGEVLADIATGKGFERSIRARKRWPTWP